MASAASAATVAAAAEPSSPAVQCLSFLFHNEAYALPLLRVREIVRFEGATRVPRVAPWVRGVVNLRGSVVPVLDLGVWLAKAESPVTSRTCLLIVEAIGGSDASTLGLVIDGVDQVLDIPSDAIEPPPSFGTLMPPEFIAGMVRAGERFVYLLDMDRLLADGALVGSSARGAAIAARAAGEPR
jgi:purine-binding chemotaxis protein CheW